MDSGLTSFFQQFIENPQNALVLAMLTIAVLAFYKQQVYPKSYYDKVEARAERAEKALQETTESLKELTQEIRQRGMARG
jgi:hypothetical protein